MLDCQTGVWQTIHIKLLEIGRNVKQNNYKNIYIRIGYWFTILYISLQSCEIFILFFYHLLMEIRYIRQISNIIVTTVSLKCCRLQKFTSSSYVISDVSPTSVQEITEVSNEINCDRFIGRCNLLFFALMKKAWFKTYFVYTGHQFLQPKAKCHKVVF